VSTGLYSGVSGLALGTGLYKGTQGLWGGASGLINEFGATLNLDFLAGAPLDSRITFTRSTTATFVGSDGLLQSSAINNPRFDYNPTTLAPLGLLIEEQRTNTITNSTGVGAVVGTPGTAPTTWAITASPTNGISMHIVGTGTESGIPYVDVRVFGTNTAAGTQYVDVAYNTTNVPAAQTQSWTLSTYYRLISGNFTGFSSVTNIIYATPLFNDNQSTSITSITNAPLIQQRITATRTFTLITTTGASPRLGFTVNIGATVDVTVRIGLPQLEQGAFATSVIPTATAQVTRAADVAVMTGTNFSSWYNQSEGTMVASWATTSVVVPTALGVFGVSDGTANERIQIRRANSVNDASSIVVDGGVVQFNNSITASSGINTSALAYKVNDFISANNGTLGSADTSGTLPTPTQAEIGFGQALTYLNGHLRTFTFYPQRLANAQSQALSV
jgi:hypothetical protein